MFFSGYFPIVTATHIVRLAANVAQRWLPVVLPIQASLHVWSAARSQEPWSFLVSLLKCFVMWSCMCHVPHPFHSSENVTGLINCGEPPSQRYVL